VTGDRSDWLEEGERNKQPTGFSSSHAKMARTKDDDDEEDWETTLNTYKSPGYCPMSLRDAFWPVP
jgi:hypothetical protein